MEEISILPEVNRFLDERYIAATNMHSHQLGTVGLNREKNSARNINAAQYSQAGTRLGQFYQAERLLDFTVDPGITYVFGNEAISIPLQSNGDDFWVHIEK